MNDDHATNRTNVDRDDRSPLDGILEDDPVDTQPATAADKARWDAMTEAERQAWIDSQTQPVKTAR